MQVVIEALAETPHLAIQLLFAGVREGRMADVVRQRQRLGQILVQLQHRGQRARDLRDLDGVRQPIAKVVGDAGWKDLRLVFQAAKSAGVDHAIAIALELVAVRMRRFRIPPPAARRNREPQTAQPGHF